MGGIAGIVAVTKHGDLSDACVGGCPPGSQGDIDGYHTAGAVSTVGFVVGGVGVATGTVLWLLASPSSNSVSKTAKRPTISPFVGPNGVGAFGSF